MRSSTIALALLLFSGAASLAAGQEKRSEQRAERRQAQPRERAVRSEPQAASAPAPPPPREDRARSRGTDNEGRARVPREYAGGERTERREQPVNRAPAPTPTVTPRTDVNRDPGPATAAAANDDGQDDRRAVPRGSRPRGDNPVVGRAEPRGGRSYPRDGRTYPRDGRIYPGALGGSRVYTSRGRVYNNYYSYYPRRWYPYGYGAFGGLGYFFYDPYTWYYYDPYWNRPYGYSYYGYGSRGSYDNYYYETGELRLLVHPRHAEVYVDGYFAGNVDDFDGLFQGLRLEEGPHTIEVVAPGYETLVFEVRVLPGRKTTYRGELRPRP